MTDPITEPEGSPALIAIEEHWTEASIDRALRALPDTDRDPSLVLNDHGDVGARLADLGEGRARRDGRAGRRDAGALAGPARHAGPPRRRRRRAEPRRQRLAAARRGRGTRRGSRPSPPFRWPTRPPPRRSSSGPPASAWSARWSTAAPATCRWTTRASTTSGVAAGLRQPVFIHPQIPPRAVRAASYGGLGELPDLALATFAWGWHLEAGTAALRLMARGVARPAPGACSSCSATGASCCCSGTSGPTAWPGWRGSSGRSPSTCARTSGSPPRGCSTRRCCTTRSRSRRPTGILFSTDYPFQRPTAEQIAAFFTELPDAAAREAFASGTARRLFRLDDPPR